MLKFRRSRSKRGRSWVAVAVNHRTAVQVLAQVVARRVIHERQAVVRDVIAPLPPNGRNGSPSPSETGRERHPRRGRRPGLHTPVPVEHRPDDPRSTGQCGRSLTHWSSEPVDSDVPSFDGFETLTRVKARLSLVDGMRKHDPPMLVSQQASARRVHHVVVVDRSAMSVRDCASACRRWSKSTAFRGG